MRGSDRDHESKVKAVQQIADSMHLPLPPSAERDIAQSTRNVREAGDVTKWLIQQALERGEPFPGHLVNEAIKAVVRGALPEEEQ